MKIKLQKKVFVVVLAMIMATLLFQPDSYAVGAFQTESLNPEFVEYMKNSEGTGGAVPFPIRIVPNYQKARPSEVLPSRYDLREQGKLTPIKDQGGLGSCWAFSNIAALESFLLPGEDNDFSENNLLNNHGNDWGRDGGGNEFMASAYFLSWKGPVLEVDDPYTDSEISSSPTNVPVQRHVQSVYFIPEGDTDSIKQAVMKYGAVSTNVLGDNPEAHPDYFNWDTYAYYCDDENEKSDHAINIVGWDDNFPKESFSKPAPADGAYICRNSWGDYWGEDGYYYVSYYDTTIGKYNAVYTSVESADNYDSIYQYDEYGWTMGYTFGGDEDWFANVFTADEKSSLKAVGFYTAGTDSEYEIYVDSDYKGEQDLSDMEKVSEGLISMPGYHTIDIPEELTVEAGDKFAVAVKLHTPEAEYPVAVEGRWNGMSLASAKAGESYVSGDGFFWNDITTESDTANVCLKAYADKLQDDIVWDNKGYAVWDSKSGVASSKTWTVNFSQELDASSIDESSVCVYDKTSGEKIKTTSEVLEDGKLAVKAPSEGYESGRTYILEMSGVKSYSGKSLPKPVRMEFTIK